ncbi:hypothetical protein GPECTOR_6g801 [Gonium pectorale]|uniref:Uncharacterized protein n=1 Tax=Gonium pectorale TaxID=33097 RepID=A0A150GVU7_GONPE|nr:hypothetical protein GPECTOR_6g801 [Gonium pectorale]|eukprot:KXZ53883.1 hypothetical protein GPECTOR_6g801 [Gonium pectorale]
MSKQRNIRRRAASEEPEDEAGAGEEPECNRGKLAETRLMQQLRRRTAGTGASSLAMGVAGPGIGPATAADGGDGNRAGSAEPGDAEPAGGGPVMDAYVKAKSIAVQQGEDVHMQKYIEEQLALRLGKSAAQGAGEGRDGPGGQAEKEPLRHAVGMFPLQGGPPKGTRVEAELYAVPADFKTGLEQEVVLPGLVSTLAEVPLSARDKLASIEATEALKRRLLARVGAGTLILEEEEEAREREAARIRRGQFAKQFGRAPPRRQLAPEELEAEAKRRRYVTERGPRGSPGPRK